MASVRSRRRASRNIANWRARIRYGNKNPADGAAMTSPAILGNDMLARIFALKTFAAAMRAFTIALPLDMPRPYWAMTNVYVTSAVLTGATATVEVLRGEQGPRTAQLAVSAPWALREPTHELLNNA